MAGSAVTVGGRSQRRRTFAYKAPEPCLQASRTYRISPLYLIGLSLLA